MNILVLGGGTSSERDVSMRSSSAVRDALTDLGHVVSFLDIADASQSEIVATAKLHAVTLPILHGIGGEDGTLQQLFDDNGIKYLGSGPTSCRQTFDKAIFKKTLLTNNILTPQYDTVTAATFPGCDLAKKPFVLKPIKGGSSIDTFIIRNQSVDTSEMVAALNQYGEMLIEELIDGSEITVGVLGDIALPVIEIIPPAHEEFSYDNKYNGATAELCPPKNVSAQLQIEAQELALKIHRISNCRHLSRTDFMISKAGKLLAIDCNIMPGLTDQSLFPKAAQANGISWNQLVSQFVELAS